MKILGIDEKKVQCFRGLQEGKERIQIEFWHGGIDSCINEVYNGKVINTQFQDEKGCFFIHSLFISNNNDFKHVEVYKL